MPKFGHTQTGVQGNNYQTIGQPFKKRFYRHKTHNLINQSLTTDSNHPQSRRLKSDSKSSSSSSSDSSEVTTRNPVTQPSSSPDESNITALSCDIYSDSNCENYGSERGSNNKEHKGGSSGTTEKNVPAPSSFFQFNTENLVFFFQEDPPIDVKDPCLVADGLRFTYFIGGYDSITGDIVNYTQVFDDYNLEWKIISSINIPRLYSSCIHINTNEYFGRRSRGLLFIFSGCSGNNINDCDDNINNNAKDLYIDIIEYMDLNYVENGWIILDTEYYRLNIPRIASRSLLDGYDNIWIIGGYDGIKSLKSIESLLINFKDGNYNQNVTNATNATGPIYTVENGSVILQLEMINNFGNLVVSRAATAVADISYDTGYSCVSILGGRSGIGNYDSLNILDTTEYLCYVSPSANGCDDEKDINVGDAWFDDCQNDDWYINNIDFDITSCDYHNIININQVQNNSGILQFITSCYHGPFGNDVVNITRGFDIDDERNGTVNLYNIEISLIYYTMCMFDSNDGDQIGIYFNNDQIWTSTRELGVCDKTINGWEWFNWTDTFVEQDAFLYRCVDSDGNNIATLDDLSCFYNVSISVNDYNDTTFSLTMYGMVSDKDTVKNWGFSNFQVSIL